MKKLLTILSLMAVVMFAGSAALAATTSFVDFLEDSPTIDSLNVAVSSNLPSLGTLEVQELGRYTFTTPFAIPAGLYGQLMLEPVTNSPSDVALLFVSGNTATVTFVSDGWPVSGNPSVSLGDGSGISITTFADALDVYYQETTLKPEAAFVEPNHAADLFEFFDTAGNVLDIHGFSAPVEVVPIPGSLLLLGSGLLGIFGIGIRRKSA